MANSLRGKARRSGASGADGRKGAQRGRKAVREKAPRPRGRGAGAKPKWTAEKERIFFRELALVCNVTAALRAAGMLRASRDVYDRRKDDAKFRAGWDAALVESYALLELEMLERGRCGEDRPPPATEAETRLRAIPTSLALSLLKMHQARAKGSPPPSAAPQRRPMRGQSLRDEMEKRFREINRRLGGRR